MDIKREVNRMYEKYPYPSLPISGLSDLRGSLHANVMRKILAVAGNPELAGKRVLDAGCGTGEKACYFSALGADSTGIDLSSASLEKGKGLAKSLGLKVRFEKKDVLKIAYDSEFDHVFCLGVLHHTEDPYLGFERLVQACKTNGTITIGLYNLFGRFQHRMKRYMLYRAYGTDFEKRMAHMKKEFGRDFRSDTEKALIADKFAHPYESYHTVGEVLSWFEKNGIEYVGSSPGIGSRNRLSCLAVQLSWMLKRQGFFMMAGRKK